MVGDLIIKQNARVVSWERTCTVFPSQWEGKMADGQAIYIRYRNGALGFGIGQSLGEAIKNHEHNLSRCHGLGGGAFLRDSEMIAEMRALGVSFENAERIGEPCEEW
jgi:hypothetical protein